MVFDISKIAEIGGIGDYDVVTEKVIETLFYTLALIPIFLWEALCQLACNKGTTIAYDVKYQWKEQPVRQEVVDAQGHVRQHSKQGK